MCVAEAPFTPLYHSTEGWGQPSPWVPRSATGHPACGVPVATRTRCVPWHDCKDPIAAAQHPTDAEDPSARQGLTYLVRRDTSKDPIAAPSIR